MHLVVLCRRVLLTLEIDRWFGSLWYAWHRNKHVIFRYNRIGNAYLRFDISTSFLTDVKKIVSLEDLNENERFNLEGNILTESRSRFDSTYAANSPNLIRFELIKRVVNEFVVLAVGIRSSWAVEDGENGLILELHEQTYRLSEKFQWLTQDMVLLVVAKDSKSTRGVMNW